MLNYLEKSLYKTLSKFKLHGLIGSTFRKKIKRAGELDYWKSIKASENSLSNHHYAFFYTEYFGLDDEFFRGKKILDIGCGPRGSLEWADTTSERIGLDPLVERYRDLGIDKHKMQYINSTAENIPFPDSYFDVVCTFNSLDHVDEVNRTIAEIARVVKSKGILLVLTEVNHNPTITEPTVFSWDILTKFEPEFKIICEKHYEKSKDSIYGSILENLSFNHSDTNYRSGYLSAKLERI